MTTNDVKQQIQRINDKSQALLMRLEFNVDEDENLDIDEITQLQTDREQLISHLFKQYPNNEIEKEYQLINQMADLDTNLKIKTESLKGAFASKLIKIKKGQKSAIIYKKY